MFNEAGELCAIASSKWCLIDMSTGRIAKLPDNLEEIYHGFIDESVFNIDDLPSIEIPNCEPVNSDVYNRIGSAVGVLLRYSRGKRVFRDYLYGNHKRSPVRIL